MAISLPDPSLARQLLRTRLFTLGDPGHFTISPDGALVLFLQSRAGDDPVTCLWALDLDSGTKRLLADPAELRSGNARPAGVRAYARGGGLVAFTLARELWTVGVAGGPPRRLPTGGPVTEPRPDPAGERIAYMSGGDLRVIEADGTGDRTLAASDGPEARVGPGTDPWAPDGTRLLVVRRDPTPAPLWYVADPADPAAAPRTVRYAAAGRPFPEVTLSIAGLDGARTEVRWDRDVFEYLVDTGWDAHGPYAVVQSRDQRAVRFLAIDADGGTRVLSERRDEYWVQRVPGLPARTGRGALLDHADLGGTRYLTVDGGTVTPPGLQLREVLGVDGEDVLFTASEEPAETHLWSWRAGEGARRLSTEPGVHSGVRRGGTLVHVARCGDRPGGRVTVTRPGRAAVRIASLVERPVLDVRSTRLVLGPRELRAALYLPTWHRPGDGRLPILLDPYGGPNRQRVTAEQDHRVLVSQWFAEQGFAVLVADGAGTPGRGPDWERELHGDLYGPVLADQVSAVREAASRHPELDLDRVGIRGWSFGGSLAVLAVLRRPDVFHAAVAGAAVTDQRLYHAFWRERFLGDPEEAPERYEACSLVAEAPKLTRPLLLIHGLTDGRVHPAHTLRLSGALLAAGRPHETLLLPGVGHKVLGVEITESLLRHQVTFLRHHLGR